MKTSLNLLIILWSASLLTGCVLVYPTTFELDPPLSGQVKDSKTGQPIEHVKVTRARVGLSTYTDAMGRFQFPRRMGRGLVIANPANGYTLGRESNWSGKFTFTHDAYIPLQLSEACPSDTVGNVVFLRFSDEHRPQTVSLTPKVANAEPVVVRGAPTGQYGTPPSRASPWPPDGRTRICREIGWPACRRRRPGSTPHRAPLQLGELPPEVGGRPLVSVRKLRCNFSEISYSDAVSQVTILLSSLTGGEKIQVTRKDGDAADSLVFPCADGKNAISSWHARLFRPIS